MKALKVGLCAAAIALAGSFAFAEENVLWVDDGAYGAAVRDGSETNPYGSLQDAIDAAKKLTYKVRQRDTDLAFICVPGASDTAGALLNAITGGARGFAIFFL